MSHDGPSPEAQAQQLERLLGEIDALPDARLREKVVAIVQSMLGLYGAGIGRMVEICASSTDPADGQRLLGAFADDPLVSNLLLLHDLHPRDLEERVAAALDDVRPYLQSHKGNVELVEITNGIVHLRLEGSCKGCPSSTLTLKSAIEESIRKFAPDVLDIVAEGVTEARPAPSGFIPLAAVR